MFVPPGELHATSVALCDMVAIKGVEQHILSELIKYCKYEEFSQSFSASLHRHEISEGEG
jgi:hypothetical protein